jgi:hypothetical protein
MVRTTVQTSKHTKMQQMKMKIPKHKRGKQTASHARSPQQERALAKRVGGNIPPGSGSGSTKGDVRVKRVLYVEAKTTKNKSFSVTRAMLAKMETVAVAHGEMPAFVVEFNTNGKPDGEFAIVPIWVLDAIVQHAEDEKL